MQQVSRIGMDTSKQIFQLHGVDAAEEPVLRKKLRRKEMMKFFEELPPTQVGDEALRSVLVVGSTSVLRRVRQRGTGSPWLVDLLKRKPPKLAAVALANKNARIAWKLMVSGERYRPAKPITGFNSPQAA